MHDMEGPEVMSHYVSIDVLVLPDLQGRRCVPADALPGVVGGYSWVMYRSVL